MMDAAAVIALAGAVAWPVPARSSRGACDRAQGSQKPISRVPG
jgi:hypothetical protein